MKPYLLITVISLFIQFDSIAQIKLLDDNLASFYTTLSVETTQEEGNFIIAYIELNNGSYVISPFSKDTVYGHVDLSLQQSTLVSFTGLISESPISKAEYDPFLETEVKYTRTNTRYRQALNINTEKDFELPGEFWFLLEPQCVPYKVEFILRQVSGDLSIEKIKTVTAY